MVLFLHWAKLNKAGKISKNGLKKSHRPDGWNGVYCIPVLQRLTPTDLAYWRVNLKSKGGRSKRVPVYFEVPDDELLYAFEDWAQRYSVSVEESTPITAKEAAVRAAKLLTANSTACRAELSEACRSYVPTGIDGFEALIPRRIRADEIKRIVLPAQPEFSRHILFSDID